MRGIQPDEADKFDSEWQAPAQQGFGSGARQISQQQAQYALPGPTGGSTHARAQDRAYGSNGSRSSRY
eukprot:gene12140-15248_t